MGEGGQLDVTKIFSNNESLFIACLNNQVIYSYDYYIMHML